jgi:hypothetical protein
VFVDKKHNQPKGLKTVLGEAALRRRVQRCNRCGTWRAAEDIVLDVVKTGFSPGLRRMMAKTGADMRFDKASTKILELAGVGVTEKDVERVSEMIGKDVARWEQQRVDAALLGKRVGQLESPPTLYIGSDGTGVPVLRREIEGGRGEAEDGLARDREVKPGAVFTQSTLDEQGNPVGDPHSTTYVGKIESSEDFGREKGLFIGSGVVEAGCKSLIGARLKNSGMHWSLRGANSIIALRCCIESRTFETYWESRRVA